jgi:D-sedoheptulose 7-phosphate isomerase
MLRSYQHMINAGLDSVDTIALNHVRNVLFTAANNEWPVLMIGNGGSAAIGDHWSCDFTKGISEDTNKKINVRNLGSNMAIMTAIANDIGYDQVFSKQIEWCNEEALVIAISSSGSSPNIVNGLKKANEMEMPTVALVGFDGGTVLKENLADFIIHVDVDNYGVVEDCHQIIMHTIAQNIRSQYKIKDTIKL